MKTSQDQMRAPQPAGQTESTSRQLSAPMSQSLDAWKKLESRSRRDVLRILHADPRDLFLLEWKKQY